MNQLMFLARIVVCVGLLAGNVRGESKVGLAIDARATGMAIPADFSGLSFETANVSPGGDGRYLFDPQNTGLVRVFKTLGIRSLRLGGSMADRPGVAIPGPKDIDRLFAFAAATDVRVIYTLRLREGNAEKDAAIAKYIQEHYRPLLTCFAIGNEPNFYIHDYADYRQQWEALATAIRGAAPGATFCGPSALDKDQWASDFARDFGKSGLLVFVTQHAYFGGDSRKVADAGAARDAMLSAAWVDRYERFYKAFAADAVAAGLHYRLEETNNFSEGGVAGASDRFAAALWALDYLHWWAAHGAAGVNFHNRRWILNCVIYPAKRSATESASESVTGAAEEFEVRPIAYGIQAFDFGGHGDVLPVRMTNPDRLNLTAYAVRDGHRLLVTIINKQHEAGGRQAAEVTIASRGLADGAESISLTAPDGDASARTGITLGGGEIGHDGLWNGQWRALERKKGADYRVDVPAASAVVLRIPVE